MEEKVITSTSSATPNSSKTNERSKGEIEDNDDLRVIAIFAKGIDGPKQADTFGRRSKSYLSAQSHPSSTKTGEPRAKVILLGEKPVKSVRDNQEDPKIVGHRRLIELNDVKSKMALSKESKREVTSPERSDGDSSKLENTPRYENMDFLQKLPPDTVVIKRNSRSYKEDSDYVRESTETSSGSSSTTSAYRPQKVKRIQRAIRNKNRSNAEIRRNPMRVTKKDIDKDFPRQRQRLLSANRKGSLGQREASKRAKSSTMPYMNTRSVTRKMYTVGATYQAPTKRDETEWKEWPVHGMHERPVYHPQAGLAVEYLGKFFTSLDGLSYREIVDQSEVEIVSVDPRCDMPCFSDEKKLDKTQKGLKEDDANKSGKSGESFASCIHGSLHSVLVYCSQVLSPSYKQNVEEKLRALKQNENLPSNDVVEKNKGIVTQGNAAKVGQIDKEISRNWKEGICTVTSGTNVKNATRIIKPNILQSSYRKILPEKKSTNLIQLKNAQVNQLKLQEIIRQPSKNVILFKTTDPKIVSASNVIDSKNDNFKQNTNDLSLKKLEEVAISDETLMEISSIYNNFVPSEENSSLKENLSKNTSKPCVRKPANKSLNFLPVKYLDSSEEKENVGKPSTYDLKRMDVKNSTPAATSGNVATWYTSDTSEIARILAEYNKSAAKKPGIQNYGYRNVAKVVKGSTAWTKNTVAENLRENCAINLAPKSQQDKWRKCRLTLNDVMNPKVPENARSSLNNLRSMPKNEEPRPSTVTSEKFAQEKTEDSEDATAKSLQELLENTSILYCAATGVHQDDLINYLDTLDAKQSVQWLETYDDSSV